MARDTSPPQKYLDVNLSDSVTMKFVLIPPGSFLMGSPANEAKRDSGETQHKVTLTKGFYLGVYLVTQEQWQAIMGSNPSKFKGERNLPVENVSWIDCQEFLKKLSEREGHKYRLPTEAEWEYACRAGTTTPFYCGETISNDQANYDYLSEKRMKEVLEGGLAGKTITLGNPAGKTTPVNRFPPNTWGLYDMHTMWEMVHRIRTVNTK